MIRPGDEPIPGYHVEAMLGRGQFGQVWRARSPGNTHIALKFLELTGSHGWKEFRAIQRVKQIRHAHLMPIVAIWLLDEHGQVIGDEEIDAIAASQQEPADVASNQTLVITETVVATQRPVQLVVATLLANQTLGDRLRERQAQGRKGIGPDELLKYMEEAAKGLDFLNTEQHQIGDSLGAVQHCDVKPDNIMLSGGSVVIADFGVAQMLARSRNDATATSLGGTPAYMPPELFQNKPCQSSDQYSLAVAYYELRTGKLPFVEETYVAVYEAHQKGTLDFSAVGPAERKVLKRATATNPAERFPTCGELVAALRDAVHPTRKASPKQTARRAAGLAAAGMAAAALGAMFVMWRSREPEPLLATASIVVNPPDAIVTVEGEATVLDSSGRAVLQAKIGDRLMIMASKPPDRRDASLEIVMSEATQEHVIELPFSAEHFAEESNRLLGLGQFQQAVDALKQAIELERDKYAQLPQPIVRTAGKASIGALQLTPDGAWLVAGTQQGDVRRWAVDGDAIAEQGELIHHQAGAIVQLAVGNDTTVSLAAKNNSDELSKVTVSRQASMAQEVSLPAESGDIKKIAIAGDGRWLVAASEILEVGVEPERRVTTLHAWDLDAENIGATYRQLQVLDNEFEPALTAAHRQPWVLLATSLKIDSSDSSYVVRQFRLDAGEPRIIHRQQGKIVAPAVSGDDHWIAVGGGAIDDETDAPEGSYRATLINAVTGDAQTLPRGHYASIEVLAFDPAGDYLTTGDEFGDAQMWHIPSDAKLPLKLGLSPVFMQGDKAQVISFASPSPGWVACCYDGKSALWYCLDAEPVPQSLTGADGRITAMTATANGGWIVTGFQNGSICFWPGRQLMLVIRASAAAGIKPRVVKPEADRVTQHDPQRRPPARYSPWENAGIGRPLGRRPTAGSA